MQAREASWEVVERLVDEQKFREAVALVAELRERAAARGAEEEWTRALVRETQLHIALHGYERAVKVLSETPWPAARRYRVALHLCRGKALLEYLRVYRWEIARREPVGGEGPKDLALWTAEEFFQEALREYLAAWEERGPLGNEPGTALALLLEANNYPPGIRSTLRDTVSYLLVDLLADSSLWRPEQGNELYRLDLTALLGPPAAVTQSTALADPQRHPLAKAVEVLGDLEAWHAAAGREEAALEARLERFRLLHRALTQEEDRLAIRQALEGVLAARQHLGWWAVGQALLVEMVANEEKPDAILRARELAREGYRKDPKGVGGQRCRNFLETTERPEFELEGMLSDGPARPSLGVVHRNVRELYLRAYRLNQQEMIDHTTRLLFQFQAESPVVDRLLARPKPDAAWRVELPQTGDFRSHRTFVTPPPLAPGAYAVVASLREDFAREGNQLAAVTLIQSELVLLARGERDGSVVVTVVEGSLGKPAADVKVTLYEYDWHRSQKRQVERWTGADGVVRFAASEMEGDRQYFLLAQRGEQRTVLVEPLRSSRRQQRGRETHAVVYTDRSVYRPGQTVHFKVVVFGGVLAEGGFRTRSNQPVTVSLRDANGETVASTRCRTNAFGSCWGEFTIPTGRLLGRWRVEATGGGAATIHVEEYKRPTFEVVFHDPAEPLRLNRPARLSGEARYYFGLPVREGKVQWRVFRESEPLRWWWDWRPPDREERLVASGEAELSAAGTFSLEFVPAADEREAKNPDVSYRFRIEADVTDPGGETRTAQRSVRLAFVAVAADIDLELGFLREGVARAVSIRRISLEGVGQKGVGRYRLVRLHQPERVLLPAEQPISPQQEDPFATPGDRTRPRWNHAYAPARVLHAWPDGETLAGGQLVHDEGGMATVTLPRLSAGCYRLRYETVDSFGAVFETAREFVVGGVKTPIALPAALFVDRSAVEVGDSLGVLVVSGLPGQHLVLEIRRQGGRVEVRRLVAGRDASLLELAIGPEDRGGIGLRLWAVRDYQLMVLEKQVPVPWTDRKLQLSFATFRDSLRPGRHESFRVKVADASGRPVGVAAAEVLAYMYDRSVDLFAPHLPPSPLDAYPTHIAMGWRHANLRKTRPWWQQDSVPWPAPAPELVPDRLKWLSGYGVGGPGRRYPVSRMAEREGMVVREVAEAYVLRDQAAKRPGVEADAVPVPTAPPQAQVAEGVGEERTLRSNFAETAFFLPALLTGEDGSVTIEFEVPDAVTAWNVWLHAITQDLRAGLLRGETRTVKELLVRPYLPRFFREGDEVRPKVVVNNTSGRELEGKLSVRIADAESGEDLAEAFGLDPSWRVGRPFRVAAGGGTALEFDVTVPRRVGAAVVTVTAATADFADGEARGVPILPARLHLSQSRFVALPEGSEKRLHFPDMAASDDPSRESESLVVTVDAQLFYAALAALPYLVEYPYECTEQILNRFLSTSILTSLFSAHPEVARMAEQLSQRETRYEAWERDDPNRRMALEETPWLVLSQGGKDEAPLLKVLDPRVAEQERQRALAQLEKAQTATGGFPWWPGGPPSPYMTLYLMYGFAKAAEFGVPVPQGVVERGWQYLGSYFREQYAARQYASKLIELDCCWEFLTFLNYVASCYGHGEWMEAALPSEERQQILDFSFRHWREHSPYLKSMLALTLARMGRPGDARLVFDSVMDSATTTENEGTFWAPEERSWLWYNDTIEGHAVALRTLVELSPDDARVAGLVHWLLLNRKTNHWHSTKATAEVLYALAKVLQAEGKLAVREEVAVQAGPHGARFVFEPDRFTGAGNRLVVPGEAVGPATATVEAANRGQGLAFVSATWHFATSRPPLEGRGDVLTVSREFYKRVVQGKGFTLVPLASGDRVEVGDEVEVRLVVRSRFPMEFVHLRDPRPAGCEPVVPTSSFKWDRGIVRYEEVRDSGINFFFENLPYGEFAFAHRLRAVTAGSFQVGPAVIQSMYAPEFVAYSAGSSLRVVQGP